METADSVFQYVPLSNPSTHIRLLEILEGDFDQRVVCKLSTWELTSAPPYYAISYTWGETRLMATIVVNGQEMKVRQNCEYVLQQSFASRRSTYYWCDAISINQVDVLEKNHQVALFGTLYERAECVLVCVGRHEDDSDVLFGVLRQKRDLLDDILRHSKGLEALKQQPVVSSQFRQARVKYVQAVRKLHTSLHSTLGISPPANNELVESHEFSMWSGLTKVDGRLVWLRCSLSGKSLGRERRRDAIATYIRHEPFLQRERIIRAFIAFMQRPYFSRLWILQELQLGRKKFLCCGRDRHAFESLLALHQLVRVWQWDLYPQGRAGKIVRRINERTPFSLEDIRTAEALHKLEYQLGCLKLGVLDSKPTDLPHLLSALRHFACSDARDKIYGTFTLATWEQWIPQGRAIYVDYNRDSFLIARDVMTILLLHLGNVVYGPSGMAFMDRAMCLRQLLRYSPDESSMAQALYTRYEPCGTETEFYQARLPDLDFHGVLLHPYDVVRNRGDLYCRPGASPDALPEIVSDNGDVLAYAPPGTEPGDWLLLRMQWYRDSRELLAIVVKMCDDGKHILTGLTYPVYHTPLDFRTTYKGVDRYLYGPSEHPSEYWAVFRKDRYFKIRWYAEDLLVFEWRCGERRDWRVDCLSSDEERWCTMRVCRYHEKSSYAIGPFDDYAAFWQKIEGQESLMGVTPFDFVPGEIGTGPRPAS